MIGQDYGLPPEVIRRFGQRPAVLLTHHAPIRRRKGRNIQGGLVLAGVRGDRDLRTVNCCAATGTRNAGGAKRPPGMNRNTTRDKGSIIPPRCAAPASRAQRGRSSEGRGMETGRPSARLAGRQDRGYTRSRRGNCGSGSVLAQPAQSNLKQSVRVHARDSDRARVPGPTVCWYSISNYCQACRRWAARDLRGAARQPNERGLLPPSGRLHRAIVTTAEGAGGARVADGHYAAGGQGIRSNGRPAS